MVIPRHLSLVLIAGILLAAVAASLIGGAQAQTEVPRGEYTPAFPDGPPIEIPPINTVSPNDPGIVPLPSQTPMLTPIFPTEEPEPTTAPPSTVAPKPVPPGVPTIPAVTPDDVGEIPPWLATATITIHTRVCDNEGFDPYTSYDLAAMEAECAVAVTPFAFTVGSSKLSLSKYSLAGMVTFTVSAPTRVTIRSQHPDGYDRSIATCVLPVSPPLWRQESPLNTLMDWVAMKGDHVQCTWFFVQQNDDINLVLDKRTCSWFDPATYSKDTVACGDELGTWGDVRLSDTDPATADIVRLAGTPTTGRLEFLDLPPGTYTVTETNPTTGTAWTFLTNCWSLDPSGGFKPSSVPPVRTTNLTLTPDQVSDTVACISVNVRAHAAEPTDASSIAMAGFSNFTI